MATAPVYLTQTEVAQLLQVSTKTLEKWRVTGAGPAFVRLGRRCVRYTRESIEAWVGDEMRSTAGV
jgi:predicted DNA-binding transcriptional regulator AlpA